MSITTHFVETIAPDGSTPLDLCKVIVTDPRTGEERTDWEVFCDSCSEFLAAGVGEATAREVAALGHDCPVVADLEDGAQ